jgi:spore coat polysaccharide biosynthesis protein SpsF
MTGDRAVGVLQARFSSTRLPGKVLAPILGAPMLWRQIERLSRAASLDALVVATSIDSSDDAIAAFCTERGIACHRGSLDDVLTRVLAAARAARADRIVRLTGDCPLADPDVIDRVVAASRDSGCDYVSNTLTPTCPDGLDVEVATAAALERAGREAQLKSEREHVMPYLYKHPELFRTMNVAFAPDRSALRWTVDGSADLEYVRAIYAALYPAKPAFTTEDVVALLAARPDIAALSGHATRNEGYAKSLARDEVAPTGSSNA